MKVAVHVCVVAVTSCTFRRSSPSEKLTPSREGGFTFLLFAATREAELFCRGTKTQSSQERRQRD